MNHQTINSTDAQGRMIVNESDNRITIFCDTSHETFILTTSPAPIARASILHVQGHGEYHCYAGSSTWRANMQSYLIMLTLSGYEVLEYENTRYEMGPGTFYWIDCMLPHHFYTLDRDQPRHAMWIHFYGPSAEFYYQQFLRLNNNSVVCRLPEDGIIEADIRKLIKMYNNSMESLDIDIAASAIVAEIAVACIRATTMERMSTPTPKLVQDVKAYLETELRRSCTLDELANQFSVNKFHLQKQFKRYIGMSPSEYQAHVRISHAKELLRVSDISIREIAEQLGFDDPSNFTRLFKKHENSTPISYRKHWINPRLSLVEK